ncbi:hypothetical protein [Pedobacter sp. Leaf250]|uniref:hypothetical protein n=1 Tax=Pedobacter sp. Leaf250 TaxID=2876559 RepID=UPI001E3258AB|nr:hypothetical protein [Pedobacter sp. Leaf250]
MLTSYASYSQKALLAYYPLYPIHEISEGYDSDMNLVYNLKLVNRAKSSITGIIFQLTPTWLNGDTQLMTSLRAEKTVRLKKAINIKSGHSMNYSIQPPSAKYSVGVELVTYSDGTFKRY